MTFFFSLSFEFLLMTVMTTAESAVPCLLVRILLLRWMFCARSTYNQFQLPFFFFLSRVIKIEKKVNEFPL